MGGVGNTLSSSYLLRSMHRCAHRAPRHLLREAAFPTTVCWPHAAANLLGIYTKHGSVARETWKHELDIYRRNATLSTVGTRRSPVFLTLRSTNCAKRIETHALRGYSWRFRSSPRRNEWISCKDSQRTLFLKSFLLNSKQVLWLWIYITSWDVRGSGKCNFWEDTPFEYLVLFFFLNLSLLNLSLFF